MTSENDLSLEEGVSSILSASSSFETYSGPWSISEVKHLLSRCTFGAKLSQMQEVLQLGLEGTIEKLFEETAF